MQTPVYENKMIENSPENKIEKLEEENKDLKISVGRLRDKMQAQSGAIEAYEDIIKTLVEALRTRVGRLRDKMQAQSGAIEAYEDIIKTLVEALRTRND